MLEADHGTVASGKIANLLLLRSDPLQSLSAWTATDYNMLHSIALEQESLAAAL